MIHLNLRQLEYFVAAARHGGAARAADALGAVSYTHLTLPTN